MRVRRIPKCYVCNHSSAFHIETGGTKEERLDLFLCMSCYVLIYGAMDKYDESIPPLPETDSCDVLTSLPADDTP